MSSSVQLIRAVDSIEDSERVKPGAFANRQRWILYFLVALGVGFGVRFMWWLILPEHRGDPWLSWALIIALSYKLLSWLYEWYLYLGITVPPRFA
jgi:hypothetical protein